MDLRNISFRALRRLKLQGYLNWRTRRTQEQIAIPLLGNIGGAVLLHRESWKADAFRQFASCLQISMVCDVGAHEGQTLVDLVRAGLSHLEVLAFEPNPPCAHYLQDLVRVNAWSRVTVVPIALSDEQRCVELELRSATDSGATFVSDLRPGLGPVFRQVVPSYSLDFLIASDAIRIKPDFMLKIDVEGAELEVLRGSREALRVKRPLVICEVLWASCQDRLEFMRGRNAELMQHLRSNDYDVFRLRVTRDHHSVYGLEEIRAFPSGIYSADNSHQCDYAFVPREYSARVRAHFAVCPLSASEENPTSAPTH